MRDKGGALFEFRLVMYLHFGEDLRDALLTQLLKFKEGLGLFDEDLGSSEGNLRFEADGIDDVLHSL